MWHIFIRFDTGSWHIIKVWLGIIYSFWVLQKYSNYTMYFTSKNVITVIKSYLSIFLYFPFLRNVKKPHLKGWLSGLDICQEGGEHIQPRQAESTGCFLFLLWPQNRPKCRSSYQPWQTPLWVMFKENYKASLLHIYPLFSIFICHIIVPT